MSPPPVTDAGDPGSPRRDTRATHARPEREVCVPVARGAWFCPAGRKQSGGARDRIDRDGGGSVGTTTIDEKEDTPIVRCRDQVVAGERHADATIRPKVVEDDFAAGPLRDEGGGKATGCDGGRGEHILGQYDQLDRIVRAEETHRLMAWDPAKALGKRQPLCWEEQQRGADGNDRRGKRDHGPTGRALLAAVLLRHGAA